MASNDLLVIWPINNRYGGGTGAPPSSATGICRHQGDAWPFFVLKMLLSSTDQPIVDHRQSSGAVLIKDKNMASGPALRAVRR